MRVITKSPPHAYLDTGIKLLCHDPTPTHHHIPNCIPRDEQDPCPMVLADGCHCELKGGKESFKALVDECTSREILSSKMMCKLSRQARAYICAYYSLNESKCKGDDMPTVTLPLIECLVKAFKTHRAAIDFDAGFVNGFVPVIEGV